VDLGRGALTAGGDAGQFSEPRTAPDATRTSARPIRYNSDNVFVSAQEEFNRVRLTGRLDYGSLDYQNGKNTLGALILQDDRDHTTTVGSAKAEYAVSPATAVFVTGSYNEHRYSFRPAGTISRNSTGDPVAVGASFDLTQLARGEFQVGYQKQDYSSSYGSASGLSALGRLEWFPSQLTTVTLSGSRNLQDAQLAGSPSYTAEVVSLGVDHELLRNLILTGSVNLENDKYNRLARTNNITGASVAAKYLLNRLVGVSLSYVYSDQSSSGPNPGPKFTVNRIMASTTLQF
jgi:hypothetical protein